MGEREGGREERSERESHASKTCKKREMGRERWKNRVKYINK